MPGCKPSTPFGSTFIHAQIKPPVAKEKIKNVKQTYLHKIYAYIKIFCHSHGDSFAAKKLGFKSPLHFQETKVFYSGISSKNLTYL